jgi:RimJ/RimL family protein N-acetyltransferase
MIHPLQPAEFATTKPLFARLNETQPMCASVLEGVYPGRVYVDDLASPRCALLVTSIESEANGAWAFLAGDPGNQAFNRELNQAIFDRQAISPQSPIIFWTCDPQDWGGNMPAVMDPLPPIWIPRYHFVARRVGFDWRAQLPEGFSVERIGEALRRRPGLELPGDVATTLDKWDEMQRLGYTERGFMDFGFVILDVRGEKPVIACWATVDFIVHGHGDLGFFTQPDYRRQGLGSIAVAAALEDGFQRGLQQVNWTCDADNPGSVRTAEKLGLERIGDYPMGILLFDREQHMELLRQVQA